MIRMSLVKLVLSCCLVCSRPFCRRFIEGSSSENSFKGIVGKGKNLLRFESSSRS